MPETAERLDWAEREMEKERDYWKAVAVYLADCHAATAEHEGRLKSTPQRWKKRFASISRLAAGLLSADPTALTFSMPDRIRTYDLGKVVKRCERGAGCEEKP